MKWLIVKVAIIVVIGLLIDCSLLYIQARDGKKLPFKLKLNPLFDPGGQLS